MSKKTRGTVTLVCGIITIVSGAILLILRLGFGKAIPDTYSSPICLVWIALGIYLCYLGRKMRKDGSAGKGPDDNKK